RRRYTRPLHDALPISAIAGEVSLQDLPAYVAEVNELQAMRDERPNIGGTGTYGGNGPAIHARNRGGNMDLALEAAVAIHAGLREDRKSTRLNSSHVKN